MHRCKECADRLKRSQLVFAQCSFLFKGRKKKGEKKKYYTWPWTNSFYRSGSSLAYCNSLNPSCINSKIQVMGTSENHKVLFLLQLENSLWLVFLPILKGILAQTALLSKEVLKKNVHLLQTRSSLWRPFFLTYLGYTHIPAVLGML